MDGRQTAMTSEPNVTPFLDVLLVLLILFMFLCLNQQRIMTAQIPDPSARPTDTAVPIVLEVKPNSMYAINTEPVSARDLERRLQSIYAGRPTRTIVVRGMSGVRYQDVITAMDIARGAGVSVVALATRYPR
jgi:biopolymer transport protein TolR